jgi:hypothetical protein
MMTAERWEVSPLIAALGAFVRAGLKPSTPLQRSIAIMLVVKLVAIAAMRIFFFSEHARMQVDDRALETHLVASSAHASSQP